MVTQHLLAILPPDNVAGEIADLQMVLFRNHGVASSQALPPLLPVIWTGNAAPESLAARTRTADLEPIGIGAPRISDSTVIIPVELGAGWSAWIDSVGRWRRDDPNPLAAHLPAPGRGFFVCEMEHSPFEVPETALSARRLSSIAFVRVAISVADPEKPWAGVDWTVEWKVFAKLRG